MPRPAWAEVQMRCAGASAHAAPCARTVLPALGLTKKQVASQLMSCCRAMQGRCPMMSNDGGQSVRAAFSSRCCLVSVRLFDSNPGTAAAPHIRWLLDASPALAPPTPFSAALFVSLATRVSSHTNHSALSAHDSPKQHGLRAPPIS